MRTNLILAILAALLALPTWRTCAAKEYVAINVATLPVMFPGFNPDAVTRIRIAARKSEEDLQKVPEEQRNDVQGFDQLTFRRGPDGWVLENTALAGLQLEPGVVNRDILDHVAAIRVDKESVLTDSADEAYRKERHLDVEQSIQISCEAVTAGADGKPQARPLAALRLGRAADQGKESEGAVSGYFVVRSDSEKHLKKVVLYEPNEIWRVSLRLSDWVKKKIHEFLPSEVESFHLQNIHGELAVRRKPGSASSWVAIPEKSPKGVGPVRQGEIDQLVEAYRIIRADSFGTRAKIAADMSPVDRNGAGNEAIVTATLRSGEVYQLWVGPLPRGTQRRVAVASNNNFRFWLHQAHAQPFTRRVYDFFDPAPAKKPGEEKGSKENEENKEGK